MSVRRKPGRQGGGTEPDNGRYPCDDRPQPRSWPPAPVSEGRERAHRGTRSAGSESTPWRARVAPVPGVLRDADRLARPVHRRRGAARHRPCAGLLGADPAAGRVRLRRRVQRVPAPRRPCGRPARQASDARHRAGPLRRRLVRRRPGHRACHPAHGPGGAGPRRGTGVPRDPRHHQHHLRTGPRPQPGPEHLGRLRCGRAGRRCPGRRRAHPLPRVGLGVLHQRAARPRRARHGVRRRACGPAARSEPPVRPGRRAHRDVVGDAGGLGAGTGPGAGLERGPGDGPRRSGPAPRLGVHQDRAASPRSR